MTQQSVVFFFFLTTTYKVSSKPPLLAQSDLQTSQVHLKMKVFNHKTSYHGGDLLWQNRLPEYPCVYHHIIKIISLNNNRAGGIFRFQICSDKIGTNWGPNEILLSCIELEGHGQSFGKILFVSS